MLLRGFLAKRRCKMCGICGFFGREDKELLKKMSEVISHRGPDDKGYYSDSICSLGMRRLSIIDVKKGHQPMHNEDNSIWIVFNGEIYNHLELREQLGKHRFYTDSDTEAIVHAYEEFGDDCVSHLNGMFAFAIWDSKKRRLLIARDRFGEKPLYYSFIGKSLFFASEIKSILQHPDFVRRINFSALHDYLSFRCNSTNESFFSGVFKLPPAHLLVYDGKTLVIRKYWNPDLAPDFTKSEEFFSAQLFERLKQSVKMRLMSEVPLGAYLSGGIDSGAVVGLMSSLSDKPVKTFSVGFEHDFDELSEAKFLADHFKTDHKEVIVKPDAIGMLPKIVWHLDEPMADPTCIPVHLLSREIKPYATVVLTGDGSDELLYGYEQFKLIAMHRKYANKFPMLFRRHLPSVAGILPKKLLDVFFRYSSSLGDMGIGRFRQFLSTDDPAKMYLSLVSIFNEDEKGELYSGEIKDAVSRIALAEEINRNYFKGGKSSLQQFVQLDIDKILAENMLMRSDKNTMAFSVEQRVPFLDHTLAEFLMTVPPGLKLKGGVDKYILRKSMAGLIPKQTIRRKKSRFFVPIHEWLDGELGGIARQMIESSDFFRKDYIDKIYRGFSNSRLYYSRQIWALLIFCVWERMFIGRSLSAKPEFSLKELA